MRRHSPYNYAFDNPIRFIDPDGMIATEAGKGPCGDEPCPEEKQEVPKDEKEPEKKEENPLSTTAALTQNGSGIKVKVGGIGFSIDDSDDKKDLAGFRDNEKVDKSEETTSAELAIGPVGVGKEQVKDEGGEIVEDKTRYNVGPIEKESTTKSNGKTSTKTSLVLFEFKVSLPWIGVDFELKLDLPDDNLDYKTRRKERLANNYW